MSAETALYAALQALAPTWPTIAPQDAPVPRITYQVVVDRDEPNYDADGSGARMNRIQVDVWAADYGTARRLAEQARAAAYAAVTVGEITGNPNDYEPDTKLHRVSFDVTAWE